MAPHDNYTLPGTTRVAEIVVSLRLSPDGRTHHAEIRAQAIDGGLVAQHVVPARYVDSPAEFISWMTSELRALYEEHVEPF